MSTRLLAIPLGVSVGAALLGWAPASAGAQELQVAIGAANTVRFISRASIEEFEGVTNRIDGYVLLDGPALAPDTGGNDTRIYVEVDLASLDTGIGLRNRHMRDNYLEVAKYPYATFSGTISAVEATPSGDFRVTTRGELTIHGVTRARELTCRVIPAGGGYRVVCGFEVLLSDHRIEIPRIMFLKLANEIRLELDFAVAPAEARSGDKP